MQNRFLLRHPDSLAPSTNSIQVSASLTPTGSLALTYVLDANLDLLRIPEPGAPNRVDGLWRHTCFEAFIAGEDGPAYREFNFSPSGEWQAYAFRGYRDGGEMAVAVAPAITCQAQAGRLVLAAVIDPPCLPPAKRLRLGLSAVVEDTDGGLSWWALRHAPGRPDFHHTDAFALPLELPPMNDSRRGPTP